MLLPADLYATKLPYLFLNQVNQNLIWANCKKNEPRKLVFTLFHSMNLIPFLKKKVLT